MNTNENMNLDRLILNEDEGVMNMCAYTCRPIETPPITKLKDIS